MQKGLVVGTGASLGAVLALPAGAAAEDFTVTNLNDSGAGSLREAAEDSNADDGADRILFKSKLSGTIDLSSDEPILFYGGDIEIIGPGARQLAIDGGGDSRVLGFFGDFYSPPSDAAVSGLTVRDGYSSGDGGGVYGFGPDIDLTISRATISGNRTANNGGGVWFVYDPGNRLVIDSSTISGNRAGNEVGGDCDTGDCGGGVFVQGGDATIRNSTISGNSAGTIGGGVAIYNPIGYTDASVEVLNSTVTGNHVDYTRGGGGLGEYITFENRIRGSIVAGNTSDGGGTPDVDDGPWATSFSLIDDVGDFGEVENDGGNLLGADPALKPLKDNGGPTDTHAIKKSPAKNAGPTDAPKSDQRGAPRKNPDIGAYELAKCEGVIVNRVGTGKKDKLKGTKKKDGMLGLGGNDKLKGKKGKDGLCGGKGKDKLIGGPGVDKLDGGPGKDKERQ